MIIAGPFQLRYSIHRIIEWFGLEGTLKIIWFQPPCHGQGHLPLDQVAQSPIQPGLEHCQGWGSHNFPGQPVPMPHHPHSEELLPYIKSKSTFFHTGAKDWDTSETLEQVAQGGCGCPIPGSVPDQVGWCFEQPGLVEGVPACGWGVGNRRSLMSLPTQTILWFYD